MRNNIDKELDELKIKTITTTADTIQLYNSAKYTYEELLLNPYGTIIGVRIQVYSVGDNKLLFSIEIHLNSKNNYNYTIYSQDNIRGLTVSHTVYSMEELDNILSSHNPFKDIQYSCIGDNFKKSM